MAFQLRSLLLALCSALGVLTSLGLSPAQSRQAGIEFRCAENTPARGRAEAVVRYTSQTIYLPTKRRGEILISSKDIVGARVEKSADGDTYEVEISFTGKGSSKLARMTKACTGKRLAILIDGEVISAPIVNAQINNPAKLIGATKKDEAQSIADSINASAAGSSIKLEGRSRIESDLHSIKLELREAERTPAKGLRQATVEETSDKIYLHKNVIITNADIIEAHARKYHYDDLYDVELSLSKEGAEKMTKLSQRWRGKPIAILLDGKVISAPTVISEITDKVAIAARFSKREAERIANSLVQR